jgi:predicted metal-binding membrane protein
MTPTEDTPRAAFSLLSRPATLAIVVALAALSILAWRGTILDASAMRDMAMGLGQIGTRMQGAMGVGAFIAMWVTMMAAMMLPTVAPFVLAHAAVSRNRGDGPLPTVVFVAGYLLVWSATGVVPLAALWAFSHLSDELAQSRLLAALAGVILIDAGAYQFAGWKRVCFDKCRSPFAFIIEHDFGGGARSALRAGVTHGVYCLGCCWAVMTVLLVVGLMNLWWMAAIFVLFITEKHWRHGLVLAKAVGIALIALGAAIILWPEVLAAISR